MPRVQRINPAQINRGLPGIAQLIDTAHNNISVLQSQSVRAALTGRDPRQNTLLGMTQNSTIIGMLRIFFEERIQRIKEFLKQLKSSNSLAFSSSN